jgi:hypothetical protein
MADIVERLLNPANVFYEYVADEGAMLREAADEIERLRGALRDIACDCEDHCDDSPYGHGAITPNCCRNFARAALGEGKE